MDAFYAAHQGDWCEPVDDLDTDGDGVMLARVLVYALLSVIVIVLA